MLAAHYLLVSNGPPFSNGTVFRDENARLRKCPAEEQAECHSVSFTQGGIGDAWSPSKIKGVRETGNNCTLHTSRLAYFFHIPFTVIQRTLEGPGGNEWAKEMFGFLWLSTIVASFSGSSVLVA